jgi:MYXO-CTERM domain-containing protein
MRRIFHVSVVCLALLPAALLLAPSEAAACSCLRSAGAVEAARDSDAVFTAKLVTIADGPQGGPHAMKTKVFTFEVTRTFKGQLDAKININTADNSAACGRAYGDPGSEWLIYARIDDEGQARDNLCSRTTALADASDDIAELEANADTLDQPNEEPKSDPGPGPADPEPEPVLPPSSEAGDNGPEPAEPSKKGCSVSDEDLGAGGLGTLLGLGLLGWTRRRR